MFRTQVAERRPARSGRPGGMRLWRLGVAAAVMTALLFPAGCRRRGPASMFVRRRGRLHGTVPATGPSEVTYIWTVGESFHTGGAGLHGVHPLLGRGRRAAVAG